MLKTLICTACIVLLIIPSSCNFDKSTAADNLEKKQFAEEKNSVSVMVLKATDFEKELLSNGKLKALQKSMLKFETGGVLEHLYLKNGKYVGAGQTIAKLNNEKTRQNLDNRLIQLEKAKLARQELLIGQGYDFQNTDSIPTKILKTANIRSGYAEALNNIKLARRELAATVLKAPFGGKMANMQSAVFDYIETGKDFCTLINDSRFEVVFELMENELEEIKIGQKLSIIPFSQKTTYSGSITEINPMVEENGMIKVKAVLNNSGRLLDGMNVKILIKSNLKNKLVVPKSAVLLRQNKEVLFRYKSGLAYWTYVKTGEANSKSFTVTANTDRGAELNEGDTIIISGNLNLAHESKVEINE